MVTMITAESAARVELSLFATIVSTAFVRIATLDIWAKKVCFRMTCAHCNVGYRKLINDKRFSCILCSAPYICQSLVDKVPQSETDPYIVSV